MKMFRDKMHVTISATRQFCLLLAFCLIATGSTRGADLRIDHVMYQDPELDLPKWRGMFLPQLKPLWLKALERNDAETRRMAADTLTMAAGRGMQGLDDVADQLAKLMSTERDPTVRRALARALVTLQGKAAAETLAQAAQDDGVLMSQIVEPALGQWGDKSLRSIWLQRLESRGVERGLLLLAIDALGDIREPAASEPLRAFVEASDASPEVRLAAARALGNIHDSGLDAEAAKLADSSESADLLQRLLAVNLLVRHQGEGSVSILRGLVADKEPAVAAAALRRLFDLDRKLAQPFAATSIASADAGLRQLGAEILIAQGDEDAVRSLGPLLNDRNPGVRRLVAQKLADFAEQESLKPQVLDQAMKMLSTEEWRGLELATMILGHLDHKSAAPRLVELLKNPRTEVAVSAAWALRRLKVPETLPAMLTQAEALHAQMTTQMAVPYVGPQCTQLMQAFGEMRYREADSLMRKFVPKVLSLDVEARAAACWSLGHFYENQPENDLVKLFAERLADVNSNPPEFPRVRQMVAVGMARMKAQSELPAIRMFGERDGLLTTPGLACFWAVEQLTGEKFERVTIQEYGVTGWFIEPFGK